MPTQDNPGPGQVWPRWALVLASAYELAVNDVVCDAALVAHWQGTSAGLETVLRDRHRWDPSMAAYYIRALRARADR